MFQKFNQTLWLAVGILSLCLALPLILAALHQPQSELNQAQVLGKNWEELLQFPNTQYVYNQNDIFQIQPISILGLDINDYKLWGRLQKELDEKNGKYFYLIETDSRIKLLLQSQDANLDNYDITKKNQPTILEKTVFIKIADKNTQKNLDFVKLEKEIRDLNLTVRKPEILAKLQQNQASQKKLSSSSSSDNGAPPVPDLANFTLSDQELLDEYQIDKNNLLDLPFFVQIEPENYQIYWFLLLILAIVATISASFCFWQFIKLFRKP